MGKNGCHCTCSMSAFCYTQLFCCSICINSCFSVSGVMLFIFFDVNSLSREIGCPWEAYTSMHERLQDRLAGCCVCCWAEEAVASVCLLRHLQLVMRWKALQCQSGCWFAAVIPHCKVTSRRFAFQQGSGHWMSLFSMKLNRLSFAMLALRAQEQLSIGVWQNVNRTWGDTGQAIAGNLSTCKICKSSCSCKRL